MRDILVGLMMVGTIGAAVAQDVPQITVRPPDGARGTGDAYVGPYGRDLPGVSMFAGRAVSVAPDIATGGAPYPSLRLIPDEYAYQGTPLPFLDSWHGTRGPGFPF